MQCSAVECDAIRCDCSLCLVGPCVCACDGGRHRHPFEDHPQTPTPPTQPKQIWAAVVGTGTGTTPTTPQHHHDFPGPFPEPPLSLEETNAMERAFLTRLDHQLFIAPATYASTYFELCSLVPSSSEEALRRQLHRMTELAGACLRGPFLV